MDRRHYIVHNHLLSEMNEFIVGSAYSTLVQLLICLLCDSWVDLSDDLSGSMSDRAGSDGSECWSDSVSKGGLGWLSTIAGGAATVEVSSTVEWSSNSIPNNL